MKLILSYCFVSYCYKHGLLVPPLLLLLLLFTDLLCEVPDGRTANWWWRRWACAITHRRFGLTQIPEPREQDKLQ